MARKPIALEMVGTLTPRERIWQAIRNKKTFTCMTLQEVCGRPILNLQSTQDYLLALSRAGFIRALNKQSQDERAKFDHVHFELVKDSLGAPRLNKFGEKVTQGTANLAMWRAMKALKEFDHQEIQRAASLGTICEISLQTAKAYIHKLSRAGYFRTLSKSQGPYPARYRLVRDTGIHPPAITRERSVFDRNTGVIFNEKNLTSNESTTP